MYWEIWCLERVSAESPANQNQTARLRDDDLWEPIDIDLA